MGVNGNKICFIICTNDDAYLEECLLYIGQLEIPDGYEVENIPIKDATSMAGGYNKAMSISDAKYKVYLHQDVMIINRRFIYDILEIFKSDDKIGLIGMVGNTVIPTDGAPFSGSSFYKRVGMIYMDKIFTGLLFNDTYALKPYEDVVVVDGLLMATQYDLPWRGDLFKGWDFYDCSQSCEFIKAGYRVVVPYMDKPWCLHDNDALNMENYEKWRQVFEREYRDIYYKWTDEYIKSTKKEMEIKPRSDRGNSNLTTTVIIVMHAQPMHTRRCIESIMEYCDTETLEIVVVDDNSNPNETKWVKAQDYLTYVYFDKDKYTFARMINTAINTLGITNDFMILDSSLWADFDFIDKIKGIMVKNSNIGTAAPLFSCDVYKERFMDNIDEHLIERLKFDSNIFDTIVSQYAAVYIRHTVWKNINGFDEEFVHPSYVIMDFQLRVLKGGYRNTISFDILLKSDSMIESKKGIGINDLNVFRDKWGIHYLNDVPNKSLIDMVTEIDMPIHNILEVGCASGYNLIELKNIYPDAALYGLELNERAVDIARCIANVECGNVETDGIPFGDVKFDVIIFGDVLEHLKDPEATVRMCSDRLSVNGRIVCSIPNIQHISVLNALIHGRFTYADLGLLDKTHIHFFTLYEIQQMFENLGYKIENILYTLTYMSQDDYNAIYILKHAFPEINEKEMQAFQYVVRVVKKM